MADLIKETLEGYVKEAKILFEVLHGDRKRETRSIEDAQRFIEDKLRYQFLTDMFNSFNWFSWHDDDFEIKL